MTDIALLGTGLLGSGLVRHFRQTGVSVRVWNRTLERARPLESVGAVVAPSPQEAVRNVDEIHFVLADDAVVDRMIDEIRPVLRQGAVLIDHSTTLPRLTAVRAERASRSGIRFLHAPVFMSPQMAADGVGLMMVAGPQVVFDALRGRLETMTPDVWYLGERPDGAAAYKLFGNAMLFAINAGLADVVAMARATDIDPVEAVGLFRRFQAGNAILGRGPKMAREDYTAMFTMVMARKDVGLMLSTAADQPLLALPAIARRMDEVIAAGGGDLDLVAIGRRP